MGGIRKAALSGMPVACRNRRGFSAEKEPESGNERTPEEKADGEGGLIFVDAWDARERYAIPSAFSAYAGYLKKEFD